MFSAKLQEIDREISRFDGEKREQTPTVREFQSNLPRYPPLVSGVASVLKGKAGKTGVRQEGPEQVDPEFVGVLENGPNLSGPSVGNSALPSNGLDVGQTNTINQDSATKPTHLKTSQESQGRKWVRLERLEPTKTSQSNRLSQTRERPPLEASDVQPAKKREVSNNVSSSLPASSAAVGYQPCRAP